MNAWLSNFLPEGQQLFLGTLKLNSYYLQSHGFGAFLVGYEDVL